MCICLHLCSVLHVCSPQGLAVSVLGGRATSVASSCLAEPVAFQFGILFPCCIVVPVTMGDLTTAWFTFFKTVDENIKRNKEWYKDVSELMTANGFTAHAELAMADVDTFKDIAKLDACKLAFLKRAVAKVTATSQSVPGSGSGGTANASTVAGGVDANTLAALLAAAAPKPVAKPPMDMAAAFAKMQMTELHPSAWPEAALVEELQTKSATKNHFVFVDLAKHLPPWVTEAGGDSEDEGVDADAATGNVGQLATALKKATKVSKRISTMHQWVAAFLRWAYAAAASGQVSLGAAMSHVDICLRVSEESRGKGRPASVAIVYDEVCRKAWAERDRLKCPGFDVNVAMKSLDKDLLSQADSLFDARGKKLKRHPVPRPHWNDGSGWHGKYYGKRYSNQGEKDYPQKRGRY